MDENQLKPLISRHLKPLFGFVLSFAPYTREQAFQISISSFAHALNEQEFNDESLFTERLFRRAIEECDQTPPTGAAGLLAFGELPSPQRQSLATVRDALIGLSAKNKALLLLRDQCHLPFERIAGVLGMDSRDARHACLAAREELRAGVQQQLSSAGGPGHAV